MTKTGRIKTIGKGILMILLGILILAVPGIGFQIILITISLGMTLRGFCMLVYYLSMARYMVGGKTVLSWGIIMLDIGIFSSALMKHAGAPVVLYVAGVNAIAGLITILRAHEAKMNASHWRLTMAYGTAFVLLAATVLIGGLVLQKPLLVLRLYAGGLFYSGALTIASAFRREAIIYIS